MRQAANILRNFERQRRLFALIVYDDWSIFSIYSLGNLRLKIVPNFHAVCKKAKEQPKWLLFCSRVPLPDIRGNNAVFLPKGLWRHAEMLFEHFGKL